MCHKTTALCSIFTFISLYLKLSIFANQIVSDNCTFTFVGANDVLCFVINNVNVFSPNVTLVKTHVGRLVVKHKSNSKILCL